MAIGEYVVHKMFNNNSLSAGQTRLEPEADLNLVAFLNKLKNDNWIPKSTEKALKDRNWYEAMKTENNSLVENNVWELADNREIKHLVAVGILLWNAGLAVQ